MEPVLFMKRVTLRARVSIILLVTLVITSGPLIYFTKSEVETAMSRSEERSLVNTLNLVHLNISSSYSRLLSEKFDAIVSRKEQLRQEALRTRAVLQQMSSMVPFSYQQLIMSLNETSRNNVVFQVYDDKGIALAGLERIAAPHSLSSIADLKGRNLALLAGAGKLSPKGEHVVYAGPGGSGHDKTLAFLLPYPEKNWTIVLFMGLAQVDAEAVAKLDKLRESLDKSFANIRVFNSGYIVLFDGNHTILVNPKKHSVPDHLMTTVIRSSVNGENYLVAHDAVGGEMEHRFVHFKPLDWYVLVSAPIVEIKQPAADLVRRQLTLVISSSLLCFAIALFRATELVRPIQILSELARQLPERDFRTTATDATLIGHLIEGRSDEVGDLARSFAFMCTALHTNIRNLMETTAAKERIQSELNVAREIQEGILPKMFPAFPDRPEFALYAMLEPAKEIGGDLYDFFFIDDDHICLVLGDVSDKGVPAALFMAVTVTMVRSIMQEGLAVHLAMAKVNDALSRDNPKSMFVTLFMGVLELSTGRLVYANGGHNNPIVVRNGSASEVAGSSGLVVGGIEGFVYKSLELHLLPGDMLFLYTDGVTEAMDEHLALYSTQRLMQKIEELSSSSVEDVVRCVRADVSLHSGMAAQSDDITMLAFRMNSMGKDA